MAAWGRARHEPRAAGPAPRDAVRYRCERTVSQLADLLGVDIKTCSRLLKTIRERGWATVEQDTKDERQRRVQLTDDGKSVVQLMHGALVDVAYRIVENVVGPQTGATFSSREAGEKTSPKRTRKNVTNYS